MSQGNFWDSNVWSFLIILAVLFSSLLFANLLKKTIPFLRKSLIPSSVLGGLILLIVSTIYYLITKRPFFELSVFGNAVIGKAEVDGEMIEVVQTGAHTLEILTYHFLGLGFVAMALRDNKKPLDKKSTREIFDSGCMTVAGYLLQAIFGLAITIVFCLLVDPTIFKASGILLPFGYGQGTGQALNYGSIYERDYGFVGGSNFGLTVAALGFLSASFGGVIYLNVLKKKGKVVQVEEKDEKALYLCDIQSDDEIPMNGSVDKFTIQVAAVVVVYIVSFLVMLGLSKLLPSFSSVFFGFNFLIGTLLAVLLRVILKFLNKKGVVKKKYLNTFLMNRIGGTAFDLMIVAGIAVIRIDLIKQYWLVLLILGGVGCLTTFFYVRFVCMKLFKGYQYEEFFAMYGMLTGTASTGVILLREIDPDLKTPASNNLIFQTLPAIVFGFPMMLLAAFCPKDDMSTYLTLAFCALFFIGMNIILFRNLIFRRKKYLAELENEEIGAEN